MAKNVIIGCLLSLLVCMVYLNEKHYRMYEKVYIEKVMCIEETNRALDWVLKCLKGMECKPFVPKGIPN